jgi:hypothetical protein
MFSHILFFHFSFWNSNHNMQLFRSKDVMSHSIIERVTNLNLGGLMEMLSVSFVLINFNLINDGKATNIERKLIVRGQPRSVRVWISLFGVWDSSSSLLILWSHSVRHLRYDIVVLCTINSQKGRITRIFFSTGQRSSEDTVQRRGVGEFIKRYHFCRRFLYKTKFLLLGLDLDSNVSNLSSHSFVHIFKIVLHVRAQDTIVSICLGSCLSSSSIPKTPFTKGVCRSRLKMYSMNILRLSFYEVEGSRKKALYIRLKLH